MYNHKWLFLSFFTFSEQFMDIPVNAMSITAVYWRKMFQNIPNIHILWAFISLNELRLKVNWCIACSTMYFPTGIDMHYAADCIARCSIFSMFLSEKLNRAASLRPETVTILQREYGVLIQSYWRNS